MKKYLILLAAPIMLLAANAPQATDPFEEMLLLQKKMDAEMARMHEQMMKAQASGNVISLDTGIPQVDLKTEGDHYELTMKVPGASGKSIDIHGANHIVTVTAEREEVRDVNESNVLHERSISSYARSVSVPQDADTEHMKSAYKDGVLTITMPKKA